jgi:hypothetical protein
MRHVTILVAILVFTPLASATAQVRPGARVRVTGHFCQPFYSNCAGGRPEHVVGRFVAWKSDTLVVQSNGDTVQVALMNVTRLDLHMGRKAHTAKGAGIGFLVGGAVGALIALTSFGCDEQCIIGWGPGIAAFAGVLFGGLGGLVPGALIGGFTKTDRWQEVPLDRVRVSFVPQRDGRFGLGASVRF